MTDYERDLWWEARERTRKASEPGTDRLTKWITQSLPGRPTQTVFSALSLGRADAGLVVDLNKYRTGRNLKAYVDAGVDAFSLRIGGPTRWQEANWGYQIDATYKPYLEELDKLGMINTTTGYIVHNPFESYSINGATGETIHTELIDDWTSGGWMPKAFVYDHEVAKAWRSTGAEYYVTPYNLVKSLDVNTDNTYKKFKRMVGIYTARWFINSYGLTEHVTYLDNVNKPEALGGPGKQRPMWYAWYPQAFSNQYTDFGGVFDELLVPSVDQTNKLLQCGSYSIYDLWQFTYTLKLTPDDIGVDANVTNGSFADYCAAFGLTTTQPPVDPPDPPVEPPTDPDVLASLARIEAKVDAIQKRLDDGLSVSVTWQV